MKRLPYWLVFAALLVVEAASNHTYDENLSFMMSVIVMIGMVVISAYRAKDAGRRSWVWALLAFVPFTMIFLGLFPTADDDRAKERMRANHQIADGMGHDDALSFAER